MGRNLTRIGIFYDGGFFSRVSNYYKFGHSRAARITIKGLHTFIRNKAAEFEKTSFELCQIVDSHYFRGRFSAQDTRDHNPDKLFSERYFEDVLMGEGVITHFFPIRPGRGEKGIDVCLALEAYELASAGRFDVLALIAGDGDFLPLVRKLRVLGAKVMLLAWDFEYRDGNGTIYTTRTAQSLIEEVTYSVQMNQEIDGRGSQSDPFIEGLFRHPSISQQSSASAGVSLAGEVKSLDYDKGYGFIAGEDGSDYFLHLANVNYDAGDERLEVGDEVKFEVGERLPGKSVAPALNVRKQPAGQRSETAA